MFYSCCRKQLLYWREQLNTCSRALVLSIYGVIGTSLTFWEGKNKLFSAHFYRPIIPKWSKISWLRKQWILCMAFFYIQLLKCLTAATWWGSPTALQALHTVTASLPSAVSLAPPGGLQKLLLWYTLQKCTLFPITAAVNIQTAFLYYPCLIRGVTKGDKTKKHPLW